MISSELRTFETDDGQFQRVQTVTFESLSQMDFFRPSFDARAFERVADLYEKFIVPSKPGVFGQLVLFRLPETVGIDLPFSSAEFGSVGSPVTAAAIALRKGVAIVGGRPVFFNAKVKKLWRMLEKENCIRIVRGKLPMTTIIPVGDSFGFLSENEQNARLKVNSSFFVMDRFDCSTPYDMLGKPIGLMVKAGVVLNPPMFLREALLLKNDGTVSIEVPDLKDLTLEINGMEYRHDVNSRFHTRPEERRTPHCAGTDIIVSACEVIAVRNGGGTLIPSSGFVLHVSDAEGIRPGDKVVYHGLEGIRFGLQVGNSVMVNGAKTECFISPFYNIRKLWSTSYPPSLYPLDFDNARAPRIVLGTGRDGRAMLAWIEGRGKFSADPSKESCGASLKETAEICEKLGFFNAVHLDGGGSAQILLDNSRELKVSDRSADDFSEAERAVPAGLMIR